MRQKRLWNIFAFLTVTSISTFSCSARAQEKAKIAWAALNPAASPMWVVQEKGLLRKLGVDAEIIGINASPIAMQALLAGDLDVIVTSVTTLVSTRLAGADTIKIHGQYVPVRAEVSVTAQVARAVDAGLLMSRLPRSLERELRHAA
jgi:ABC-type nitrate/sulfonate/bicarbonate transport system substrate-binding protein